MSGVHVDEIVYDEDGRVRLHETCVTDLNRPEFEHEWQRRGFGLAVALSEFGHYDWDEFQAALIETITEWQSVTPDYQAQWEYYEHWVAALLQTVDAKGMLQDGYVGPREQEP